MPSVASTNINGLQTPPYLGSIGTPDARAIVLNSGFSSGTVSYQIRRKDRQGGIITIKSTSPKSELVLDVSSSQLKIILSPRTKYEFRVQQNGGEFSSWVAFKTRGAIFRSPDAVTESSAEITNTGRGATVVVSNAAKATVRNHSSGAIVINNDKGFSDVSAARLSSRGETVVTKTSFRRTSKGLLLDTTQSPTESSTGSNPITIVSVEIVDTFTIYWTFSEAVEVTGLEGTPAGLIAIVDETEYDVFCESINQISDNVLRANYGDPIEGATEYVVKTSLTNVVGVNGGVISAQSGNIISYMIPVSVVVESPATDATWNWDENLGFNIIESPSLPQGFLINGQEPIELIGAGDYSITLRYGFTIQGGDDYSTTARAKELIWQDGQMTNRLTSPFATGGVS